MLKRGSATRARICCALLFLCTLGCRRHRSATHDDQDEYVDDVAAFTKTPKDQVLPKMMQGSVPLKQEWEAWEKDGPMTPERIKTFYKQTANYIYDLGEWHLWTAEKRRSDVALVDEMRAKYKPKNILDFGGGVGLNALPLPTSTRLRQTRSTT